MNIKSNLKFKLKIKIKETINLKKKYEKLQQKIL